MNHDRALPAELSPGVRAERFVRIEARDAVDADARTVSLAFASETPVPRGFGNEVLDLRPQSVRLDRLRRGGALLVDHDSRDQVGVVESVAIGADRVARAVVRFGRSARASEVFQDVRDGIRQNVSVGYQIHDAELQSTQDGVDTYRVTDWEPHEISIVSVPADVRVGVGRSRPSTFASAAMNEPNEGLPAADAGESLSRSQCRAQVRSGSADDAAENQRVADIARLGQMMRNKGGVDMAQKGIAAGWSFDYFRDALFEKIEREAPKLDAAIGMNEHENAQRYTYSLARALGSMVAPRDVDGGYEREVSQELAHRMGRKPRGLFMPMGTLNKRAVTVGGAPALVGVQHMGNQFIDVLKARSVILTLGPTVFDGLKADATIPRLTASSTAQWIAGDGSDGLTDSTPTFDGVPLTPRTLGGLVKLSRKMILQGDPATEQLVMNDLASVIAVELDRAAIQGSGASNQPVGVVNTSGVGSGTFAAAAPTFAEIVAMETALTSANADASSAAYVTTPALAGSLKVTPLTQYTGQMIWSAGATPGEGAMNGKRAFATSNVPAGKVILGNWADFVVGTWSAVDIELNPYEDFAKGVVSVRAFTSIDFGVRHPQSFAVYSVTP